MTFISYAQNFEDVMLWRALCQVLDGFYIDIGAQDPVVDSVSCAFYEHGWRGVHVEPTNQFSKKLRQARPDEIVEQVAIGKYDGDITFYEFIDTGLSTADFILAEKYRQSGFHCIETKVRAISLDKLFEKYGGRSIHWMKLDVEGLEKDVLESWQSSEDRPWILVIESTIPLSLEESHLGWEQLVLDKGYVFAYFDGLNRFYAHQSHSELIASLSVPPNFFDDFILSELSPHSFHTIVEGKVHQAEARATHAEARATHAEARAIQAEARATQAEACEAALLNSASWRITAPLRRAVSVCLDLSPDTLKSRANTFLHHVARYAMARPRPRTASETVLNRIPTLRLRLGRILMNGAALQVAAAQVPADLAHLTPRARRIYANLKAAVKHRQEENG